MGRTMRGVMGRKAWLLFGVSVVIGLQAGTRAQSLTYTRGQNVAPAYEGWEEDSDGSRYFVFGYMNRNWEEELDVPIGPNNAFNIGGEDRGQPTHFLPRRNRFVFRVPVPPGFTETDELIWTLTTRDKTEKAYATLRTDYKMDTMIRMSETGALGAGSSSPEVRANTSPSVELETGETHTVTVGDAVELIAIVTDDGIPQSRGAGRVGAAVANRGSREELTDSARAQNDTRGVNRDLRPPSRSTVGKNVGLHISWFVYRGAGEVTFDPPQIKSWEDTRVGANSPWSPVWEAPKMPTDGRIVTRVTFAEPGTYVLRGLADDGGLTSSQDVTITVTASR